MWEIQETNTIVSMKLAILLFVVVVLSCLVYDSYEGILNQGGEAVCFGYLASDPEACYGFGTCSNENTCDCFTSK